MISILEEIGEKCSWLIKNGMACLMQDYLL